ncbi:MAG: hypothetical protein JNK88_06910 [Mangrovicoccus sp.]|nr:hypothetical protein [Mangrovicoccus sp.]
MTLAYALMYDMFFLMSFALEHGFGETPRAAGFRLAIIPVVIGAGRIGAVAMALCLGGLSTLILTLGLSPEHHLYDTLAFALIGVGLGLFIAPNSAASIAAAPADLSGAAGSLLNLMRVLGTSLGVAVGATTLALAAGQGQRRGGQLDHGQRSRASGRRPAQPAGSGAGGGSGGGAGAPHRRPASPGRGAGARLSDGPPCAPSAGPAFPVATGRARH